MTNGFDTVEIEALKRPKKSELIKALTPILVAVISLIGSIVIAFFQFGTDDKVDAHALKSASEAKVAEQKMEFLVDQINTSMIPSMQGSIKDLTTQNMELRERVVRLETKLDIATKQSYLSRMYKAATKKAPTKQPIQMIRMQK